MNILFVTNYYYPRGDATSVVVHNLARALLQKSHKVRVLALTDDKESSTVSEKDGVIITNIYVPEMASVGYIINDNCDNPIRIIKILIRKSLSKLGYICAQPYNIYFERPHKLEAYVKGIKQIVNEDEFDLIIPTLMPIEAVHALILNRFVSAPVALYQLDTYWNNGIYSKKFEQERFELEKKINRKSIICITTPQIIESNQKKDKSITRKQIAAEFPMILEEDYCGTLNIDGSFIHAVFLGTLYPDIRPPKKIIEIISRITSGDLEFDFYGRNLQLISELKEYKNADSRIILHGLLPTDEATIKKCSADILLNIDNTCPQQVPSKIFEYISTGKPIINFYFTEESNTLPYLEKYPLVLNINVNTTPPQEAARAVEKYIKESAGKSVPWEYIKETYKKNTPEYVADQFLDAYEKYINSKQKKQYGVKPSQESER